MNKEFYLKRLRSLIRGLPDSERATIIDFYREIIEDKIENGQTETQAVGELGDVNTLAQKILMENPNRKPRDYQKTIGIVLASFCGIFIVASIVIFALSFTNIKVGAAGYTQSAVKQAETSEKKTVTFPTSKVTSVRIDAENKNVIVSPSIGDTVTITYFTDKDQTDTVTTDNGEVKLVDRDTDFNGFFHLFDYSSHGHQTQITVSVPKDFSGGVSINTSNSGVTVSNMDSLGELDCGTSNAKIQLNKVHAKSVSTDTSNASIHLTEVNTENLGANSSNGSIVLNGVTSPKITLDTSNAGITGSINGKEEDYTIHTDTSNADCSPSNRSGGSKTLTANTSNGSIDLAFTE